MADLHVLILAAGKGTRMRSAQPKVLHRVGGRPMVEHVLRAAAPLGARSTVIVVGHGADQVEAALARHPGLELVVQPEQLGTAHAVMQAETALAGRSGTLLLLAGDVPLLRTETLQRLVEHHAASGAAATVLTAEVDRPFGYGRIVRANGGVARIVEERDTTPDERAIREINTSIYALEIAPLFDGLRGLPAENAQGEFYLTDLVAVYGRRDLRVETVATEHPDEFRGINSRADLAEVSAIVRQKKNDELMAAGVTIEDPATTYVDQSVSIGADTVLHPGVSLEGDTTIGGSCEIHSGARVVDSTLGDGVLIRNHCVIERCHIASGASVGPFAHLRPDSVVGAEARVGNFVELKKTTLGAGSKANHLTYLGDTTVGERANIGAGTITCNYDGTTKHPTVIEDEVFVGSDSQLVAPVRLGRGAYVAAGSSITEDVPAGALGIARARQSNKPGWAERRAADRGKAQPRRTGGRRTGG